MRWPTHGLLNRLSMALMAYKTNYLQILRAEQKEVISRKKQKLLNDFFFRKLKLRLSEFLATGGALIFTNKPPVSICGAHTMPSYATNFERNEV